jgi:CheY-like chemotaxis protein
LIVEDEAAIADAVKVWADSYGYDLVVLDVILPGLDGFSTCTALRARGFSGSILMLTARAWRDPRGWMLTNDGSVTPWIDPVDGRPGLTSTPHCPPDAQAADGHDEDEEQAPGQRSGHARPCHEPCHEEGGDRTYEQLRAIAHQEVVPEAEEGPDVAHLRSPESRRSRGPVGR